MNESWVGVLGGVIASAIVAFCIFVGRERIVPAFLAKVQRAPRIGGIWLFYDEDKDSPVGDAHITQIGRSVRMRVHRILSRRGEPCNRTFNYKGEFHSGDLILLFEEQDNLGYLTGVSVFRKQTREDELKGVTLFFDQEAHQFVSLGRRMVRSAKRANLGGLERKSVREKGVRDGKTSRIVLAPCQALKVRA